LTIGGVNLASSDNRQNKLMIIGSMDEFCALVRKAQERGIYTIVCDGYANGPAKAIADEAYTIDPRDTDRIAELCMDLGVDAVFGTFSDLLAECLVDIADKAGLPCYAKPERFAALRDKAKMNCMFEELGIPAPRAAQVHRESIEGDIADLRMPLVVKPVNGYGSRGVYVVETPDEIAERFDEIVSYSSFDFILAEEYNTGHEFNMMNWMLDGEPVTLSIADREKSQEVPHAIPHISRLVYPSVFTDEVLDDARDIVRKVAAYVGIETGPLCMQFFWSPDQGIQVCECAGRLFGYEHELLELASGLSVEELILNHLFDRDALVRQLRAHDAHLPKLAAGLYFHGYEGEVADVSAAVALLDEPYVVDGLVYYQPGDVIGHEVGAKPYVARYYVESSDRIELDRITQHMFEKCCVADGSGNNLLYKNQLNG